MSWRAAVLLAGGLGAVGLTFASAFVFIPRSSRSIYRYELWRIRDAIIDDLRSGALPRKQESVLRLVRAIEAFIRLSERMTTARMFVFYLGIRDHPTPPEASRAGLTEDEQLRLEGYRAKVRTLTINHLLLSSPSGWLAIIVSPPLATIDGLRRFRAARVRPASELVGRPVETEMNSPDVLLAAVGITAENMQPLAACAG